MIFLRHILLASILILLPCFVESAFACRCPRNPPSCVNFSKADAVFVGTVKKVSTGEGFTSVLFSVEQSFHGVKTTEIELKNAMTSCEMGFGEGKTYFVYAYGDAKTFFGTNQCSGTQEITNAAEDLSYAKYRAMVSVAEQSLVGRIFYQEDESRPIAGVKMLVSGNGKSYTTFTDKNGRFKIAVAEPGKYIARIFLPKNSVLSFGNREQFQKIVDSRWTKRNYLVDYEFEVKSGECALIDLPKIDAGARWK